MTNTSSVPGTIPTNYEFIRFWKDGCLLLGASDLTGRMWNGTLCHFGDADKAPNLEHCTAAKEMDSGVCDAITLPMTSEKCYKAVVGCDYGGLEMIEMIHDEQGGDGAPVFTATACSCEHDDALVSISMNSSQEKVISGSFDKSIKIWDLASWVAVTTYTGAHSSMINKVAYHHEMPDIFASCSRDGRVLMWDSRLCRPATIINRGPIRAVPTAVEWQPNSDSRIVIGDEVGGVMVTDIRNCNGKISHVTTNDKAIFRLEFMPWSGEKLAICADETTITVVSIKDNCLETLYRDFEAHSDFVHGIAWHPVSGSLYSCGWDATVKRHFLTVTDNNS